MGVELFKLNRVRWDNLVWKLFVSVSLVSTISINIVAKGIAWIWLHIWFVFCGGVFILFWVHGKVKEYKISVSIAKLKMT